MIKFMWNGIKVDGKLHTAGYSMTKLINSPEGTITIYAREYTALPKVDGLNTENNSDIMTDYFEKDRIRVTPENAWYPQVLEAYKRQSTHNQKRHEKWLIKHKVA